MISCGSEEAKLAEEAKKAEEASITYTIVGTWTVDVDRTITQMQQSPSFNSYKDEFKEFMLKVSNETLPHVKYTFLDNGTVENNSPIIGRDTYKNTIWNEQNNQVTMTVILENTKLPYKMKFENADRIEMISTQNDQVFYLIRN